MKVKKVPFYRLELTSKDIERVVKTLRSGWLTTGEVTHQFETEFARYIGSRYAVAVNSCTAALHLSLLAAGVGPGDEVITTPYTFVATTETIIQCGARPVFVDTERSSLNIDLDQVRAAVTERTKAFVPVSIAGLPVDLGKISTLRREFGFKVIHDAAHALGAAVGNTRIGAAPDLNCFSFYSTKNLTTGEGGMITFNNREYLDKLRLLSLHGMSRNAWNRYSGRGTWRYQVLELGYKYNLTDIAASLGLMQLRRFDKIQRSRRAVAQLYQQHLSSIDEIELPYEPPGVTHAWHLYIVRLRRGGEKLRNRVIEALKQQGVATSVHFIPLYEHPYYKKHFSYTRRDLPNSYNHYKSVLTLPFYVGLNEDQVKHVANALRKSLRGAHKSA